MKIVDVCAFYAPQGGGVKTYVEQKLANGPARGHEIVIIAPGDEDRSEAFPGGGRIEWVKSPQLPVDRRYRYFDDEARLLARAGREQQDGDRAQVGIGARRVFVDLEEGARAFAIRPGNARERAFDELAARGAPGGKVACELGYSPHGRRLYAAPVSERTLRRQLLPLPRVGARAYLRCL